MKSIINLLNLRLLNFNQVSFVFFITTIPLSLGLNNIALILFVVSIFFYKPQPFQLNKQLLVLLILFVLFSISYFWSIDKTNTLKSLPRSLVLIVLPICFMFLSSWTDLQKKQILNTYSYGMFFIAIYYLIRALIRYFLTFDTEVFFYHGSSYVNDQGLVPIELNAIHVSVFVSLAYFIILSKINKNFREFFVLGIFTLFIFLLSSKNIILIFVLLNLVYLFYFSTSAYQMRLRNLIIFLILVAAVLTFGKIRERIAIEFANHSTKSVSHHVIHDLPQTVNVLSIREAWEKEKFTPNDFFPGTAFRIYQFRLFLDFLKEDQVFWTGFGYAASQSKIEAKGLEYNVFLGDDKQDGYQTNNFHNQYVQVFAEIGVFGFVLLLLILGLLLKKGLNDKDFLIIAFVILMFSVFLTESFLWRQRGIVFFTAFYCLFLCNNNLKKTLEN